MNALQTRIGEVWLISVRYALEGNPLSPYVSLGGSNAPVYGAVRGQIDHGDGTVTVYLLATIQGLGAGSGLADPILLGWGAMPVGAELTVGDSLYERAAQVRPYFDGSMPYCAWTGTPDASASVGYPPLT